MYARRYRRAQQYFEEAVAHDPSAKHWFNLALADFQVGPLEETASAAGKDRRLPGRAER